MTSNVRDWSADPDWCSVVVGQTKHASHHVGLDACGNWFCRECSDHRGVYYLPDHEVSRMLLIDRPARTAELASGPGAIIRGGGGAPLASEVRHD